MIKDRDKRSADQRLHTLGKSEFIDDIKISADTLYATVFTSPVAHAEIKKIDIDKALNANGVVNIFTAKDVCGKNQIGAIIEDEQLLADGEVHYIGQPVALIVSETKEAGVSAKKLIKLVYKELEIITDPREAYKIGYLIAPQRTFVLGDIDNAWKECKTVVSGKIDTGGQEHFYLEPQSVYTVPIENDGIKVFSSTQSPTGVQKTVSKVLGIADNKVEVDVRRLGGAFGGKEDQASQWAALASLASFILKRPVKLILNRNEDIKMTGKRHPYSYDYKIGMDENGKILAYEVFMYQNSGASADLSTAILERSLFHATNTYFIPNVRINAVACRTNLPPFTAFRGFGAPQAVFAIEYAMNMLAEKSGIDIERIRELNYIKDGDVFPYGMLAEETRNVECERILEDEFNIKELKEKELKFNKENKYIKKGSYTMPVCFGISFTNSMLNQAGALVHIYSDGSILINTGAVEMGQNVNLKIAQIASSVLSVSLDRIKVETTNTTRVANTSPTAASSGADLNGKAAETACNILKDRLLQVAAKEFSLDKPENIELKDERVLLNGKETELTWNKLVLKAYLSRVNLTGQGFYATPDIYFDREKEKGKPFAYHVYGTAVIGVKLECLTGVFDLDYIKIVHDVGHSINPLIDIGQVEGAVIQGIGWMTTEELIYGKDGSLLNGTASGYKVPDIKSVPDDFDVYLYEGKKNDKAVFGSKAVGEPPFLYGIGAYFALRNAMKSFKTNVDLKIDSPITPQKILCKLYGC